MNNENQLFKCNRCDHIDILYLAYPDGMNHTSFECSLCQTGVWHDLFPYQKYNPKKHFIINGESMISLE